MTFISLAWELFYQTKTLQRDTLPIYTHNQQFSGTTNMKRTMMMIFCLVMTILFALVLAQIWSYNQYIHHVGWLTPRNILRMFFPASHRNTFVLGKQKNAVKSCIPAVHVSIQFVYLNRTLVSPHTCFEQSR